MACNRNRAFGLIELMVVMVLLIALFVFVAPRYFGQKREGAVTARSAIQQANDTVCLTNMMSVRQSIAVARTANEGPLPATLAEMPGLSADLRKCPVGGEPYEYDPRSGAVRCPHPGHQAY